MTDQTQASGPVRRNRLNLVDLAYDRLEEMIVTCDLKPGLSLSIQELQTKIGLGRTPVHQAINRLAGDTLISVHPRHGLRIVPIDLSRERTLLQLRGDMERFVVRLAVERATGSHRNQMRDLIRRLRMPACTMDIAVFNQLDRRSDRLLTMAAAEPFLQHTLGPLHTIFRRIGWVFHSWVAPGLALDETVHRHLAVLEAILESRVDDAITASDELIRFSGSMFDTIEQGIDPELLDCSLALSKAS